ncbi:hypothetical protein Lser_V15G40390 [Lactuca serriola]
MFISKGYLWKKYSHNLGEGFEEPNRSRNKLLLTCSLIITFVIPPELPMELSIAVNTSLIPLARHGIFCTKPFSYTICWEVDICCFDKTGTLTSDDMEFSGVGGLSVDLDLETDTKKIPTQTLEILLFVHNKLVGDPLEKVAIKGIEWSYQSDEKAMPKNGSNSSKASLCIPLEKNGSCYSYRRAVLCVCEEGTVFRCERVHNFLREHHASADNLDEPIYEHDEEEFSGVLHSVD